MKLSRCLWMLFTTFPLTACYIGPGGICGPQTPIAYCQSEEELNKLLYPKPYRDYWIKSGMNEEQRKRDWVMCGGKENGNFSPRQSDIDKIMAANEISNEYEAVEILRNELKKCIRTKSYEYYSEHLR